MIIAPSFRAFQRLLQVPFVACALLAAVAVHAADYRGPIRVLVGYPPVGPADTAASLPGVPSFADAGLAGLEVTDFLGIYAPAATPDATIERYNAALNRTLAMPEVLEKLRGHVMTVAPGSPAEHRRLACRFIEAKLPHLPWRCRDWT